jgi:hypothetical protein
MTNATSALTLMDAGSESCSYRLFLNGPLIRSDHEKTKQITINSESIFQREIPWHAQFKDQVFGITELFHLLSAATACAER